MEFVAVSIVAIVEVHNGQRECRAGVVSVEVHEKTGSGRQTSPLIVQ